MVAVCERPASVFHTCGVDVQLSNDQPEKVKLIHTVPKGYDQLAQQRATGSNCDVTVNIGEKKTFAHKAVLISRIPFFNALFNSNMLECATGEVNLSADFCEFDLSIIKRLVSYAYTGRLTITHSNVKPLMRGAVYFQIDSVMDECARFMRRRMTKNFVPITLTSEFVDLPFEDVYALLQRDSLYVDDEKQIFDAITRWIGADADRRQHAAKLLKCVRCAHLNESFLTDIVEKADWVRREPECMELVNEAKELIRTKDNTSDSFKTTARTCEDAHRLIFAIGTKVGSNTRTMLLYDPISNTWTKTGMSVPTGDGIAVVDRKIYIFGGWYEHQFYHTATNEWFEMPKMPTKKLLFSTGVIDGKIYIAGGVIGGVSVDTLDAYDPSSQEWTSLASMPLEMGDMAHCVLGGKLYAIGGSAENRCYTCCHSYDPETNRWSYMGRLQHARCGASAAVLNGQIYVVGGRGVQLYMDSLERYDPATNTWTTLRSMKTARICPNLIASCGKLFVVGGYSKFSTGHLTSVEMYDPETDTWEERGHMRKYTTLYFLANTFERYCTIASLPELYQSLHLFPHLRQVLRKAAFAPSHSNGFKSFLLKDELLKAITEIGFKHPSQVQHEIIPQAIRGMDVNCQARSGLGKSTIFVIATLEQLEPVDREVSVLVLCQTRKQASAISQAYKDLSKYLSPIKVSVFNGDDRVKKNKGVLKNNFPHIVIGTPGRILSLVKSGALKLDKIKHFILDECDKMISDKGMRRDIEQIAKFTPQKKQTVTFSTTHHKELPNICKNIAKNREVEIEQIQHNRSNDFIDNKKDEQFRNLNYAKFLLLLAHMV